MSLLDRLKFWKREEPAEFELGRYPGLEAAPPAELPGMAPPGGAGITEMPAGMPSEIPGGMPAGGPPPGMEDLGPTPIPPLRGSAGQPVPSIISPSMMPPPGAAQPMGDMQLVNAKLDTLKALLDSINARLERMERQQRPLEEEPMAVRRWR
jgi:hypothetical protein